MGGYWNHQCGRGSEDKCLFNRSYETLKASANSSATVEEKFEAMPIVFSSTNSKLTGLGFMVGLASLAGGAGRVGVPTMDIENAIVHAEHRHARCAEWFFAQ